MVSVNMREMLEAGVHFGHQVRKWNPKMKPYIYGKKNGIYIINLQTSIELFKSALYFIIEIVSSGKDALIVGTKKQAQSIVTEISEETGMHYINKRWLGGLLTNFSIIKKSIDKLLDLDEMKRDGRWDVKPKKEQSKLEKIYKKLHKNLWGVRNMKELPGVVIIIDSNFEDIAVYEAKKLDIPIVAIVDTNANPEDINYPVPGNDDAIRSIKLFTSKFGEAVQLGLGKRLSDSLNQEKIDTEESTETDKEEAEEAKEIKQEEVIAVEKDKIKKEVEQKEEIKKEKEENTEVKKEKPIVEEKKEIKKEEKLEVIKEEPIVEEKKETKKEKKTEAKKEKPKVEEKKDKKKAAQKEEKNIAKKKSEKKEVKKEKKIELKEEKKEN